MSLMSPELAGGFFTTSTTSIWEAPSNTWQTAKPTVLSKTAGASLCDHGSTSHAQGFLLSLHCKLQWNGQNTFQKLFYFSITFLIQAIKNLFKCSVQFSRSVVSDSSRPHESQHARPPCPSPTPGVHPDSRPSSQWCRPAISSSVVPFSSCPQSLPASGSFQLSQLFAWGGQRTGVSALASFLHGIIAPSLHST